MKTSLVLRFSVALIALVTPVFGDDATDMLSKSLDLVHQVENPTGNPPADAQRIDLLTQAIATAQQAPNHRLKGHRVLAIQAIRSAIAEIRNGDPNHQAAIYLHTADTELSTSISLAGTPEPPGQSDDASIKSPLVPSPSAAAPSTPSPTDGTSPQEVIARLIANASQKPLGPVENDVTEQTVGTASAALKSSPPAGGGSLRDSIVSDFIEFTLEGPLNSLYSDGSVALFYGTVKLTDDELANHGDVSDDVSFGDSGGYTSWLGSKTKDDAHVIATFCLVKQHGLWKVHAVYLSNDLLGGSDKDFIIRKLTALAKPVPDKSSSTDTNATNTTTSTSSAPLSEDPSWMAHATSNITPAEADIFNAARGGDLSKLKTLLTSDPTLAQSHVSCEMTPLLGAAAGGHADAAVALLDAKADVNAKNWINQTPLHYSAIGGFKDVADLLIAHGADVNARDKNGHTPLYEAMNQVPWRKDMAALLLAHGADPNISDNEGKTPLHEAAGWIRTDKVEFLLGYKVDVNAREKNGDTPLYVAISYGARDDIAQMLLAHGADPTIKGHDGLTPREVAMQKGDKDMASILSNPTATLGAPPAPVDGIAPPDLIARFMTDITNNPPGPVENDVTEEVVQMMGGMAQLTKTKVSPREAAVTGFGIFTLDGPVTEFYAQGLAAIYEGKATLTDSAAKNFQDDNDQSSATWTDKGKTVTDKGPFLGFGPGIADFTDAKIPADRKVVVSFCLVQQHGHWKVHCLYFSNAPLAGDHKDFVIKQLAAFSRKQGG